MGFLDFLKQPDINQGVQMYRRTPGAVLLDVRTPEEYAKGHIPGSRNIPLQTLDSMAGRIGSLDTPLFVYCRSGSRSGQAAGLLQQMGFTNVQNIGGILGYSGSVER